MSPVLIKRRYSEIEFSCLSVTQEYVSTSGIGSANLADRGSINLNSRRTPLNVSQTGVLGDYI